MKKRTRAVLITAVCCIAAGCILMGAGAAAGGYEQLRTGDFDYMRLGEGAAGGWTQRLLQYVRGNGAGRGVYQGEPEQKDAEVLSGDFVREISYSGSLKRLETNVGVHILEIREGDGDTISFEGKNCDRVQCYVKNGTLYVKDVGLNKKYNHINGRELVLTVPKGIRWESVEMDVDIGGVELEALEAKAVDLETEIGSIQIGQLTADFLKAQASMGSVEIQKAQLNGLEAEADMGSIELSGTVDGDIEADAEMGSIVLALAQKWEDFNYEISAELGTVTLGDEEYSGMSSLKEVDSGADFRMVLNSSMGDIDISFEQR